MVDPAVLPGFLAAVCLVTIAPGPDNAYVAAVAADRGARAGVVSAVGMALGMVVHVVAAALGLAVLLRSVPEAMLVIRLGGATYLTVLAVSTIRAALAPRRGGRPALPDGRLLVRAVLTNLTNPKVIVFFAAFLPQFVRAGHGPDAVQLLTLGTLFLLVGLVCDSAIGVAAGRLGSGVAQGGRAATSLSVVAGLTFAGLAAALLVEAVTA